MFSSTICGEKDHFILSLFSETDQPTQTSATMKWKQISLQKKLMMIQEVEEGKTQTKVAEALGLPMQTVNTIKNKDSIVTKEVAGELQPKRFLLREALFWDVEDAPVI